MKTKKGPSKVIIFIIILIVSLSVIGFYAYKSYSIYKSMEITIKKNTIEYGTANYDLKEIVDKVDGEIVSIKKSIDTNTIGKQEIVVEVEKDSIVKTIPIQVEIVDSKAPQITLKNEKISFIKGEEINFLDNITGVVDAIDGDIQYKEVNEVNEKENNYYTVNYTSDVFDVGSHTVTVKAVDKYGNVSEANFEVEIVMPVVQKLDVGPIYNDLPANASSASLVDIAYSLLGKPYVAGGNNITEFDCSGFVQYVYAQVGKSISRSSSTQAYDGASVTYEAAQPGDIISWGNNTTVTHSALYVGNGLMIHAANPMQGVILSDVNDWLRGSGTYILSVRRIL